MTIPCGVVMIAAVVLLAPSLSRLLYPTKLPFTFLPGDPERITPEPLEGTRYLILLITAMLLAVTTVAATRWRPPLPPRVATTLAGVAQLLGAGIVIVCLVDQHEPIWRRSYFDVTTLTVAALIAIALVLAARSGWMSRRGVAWLIDTRLRRALLLAVALLITAIWILPAVNSERSITWWLDPHDNAFHFDETFAVLNGLTPLTNFNAQYGSVSPFLIALSMLAFGKTYLVFTITLCTLSVLALIAIYGVLRRVSGSALAAFALYVPFVATSVFIIEGESIVRGTPGTYFPMFPLRYGGPYLLAFLVARQLEERRPSTAWPLFVVTGFVVLNNIEFGVAALGATIAALLCTALRPARQHLLRLALGLILGVSASIAIYACFSLLRAGSLPAVLRTVKFALLYGVAGYSVAPIPGALGLPLVIFMTYAAAIATATVRALDREANRTLTGLLMWSGVFGLGSATYYVARSEATLLPTMFSGWALALTLLAVVVLQRLARSPTRRLDPATLLVAFGIGITACSVAQLPLPWAEVQRIESPPPGANVQDIEWSAPPSQSADARRFVSSLADGSRFVVKAGAPVALFPTTGHRIADAYDVVNVVPFTGAESIHTVEQLEESLDALRDAGGNTALVAPAQVQLLGVVLRRRGFAILTHSGLRRTWPGEAADWPGIVVVAGLTKWVDTRHLHPAALD